MTVTKLALFRRFPSLAERISWVELATLPTPVEPLALPGTEADLWIKRDDLSAVPYGGNKVRKLEFLLARAEARGARRVITGGALGSHHGLATAVYGRQRGLGVTLCLSHQELSPHVRRNLRLDEAVGAEIVRVPRMELIPVVLHAQRVRYRKDGAMIVPPGGSDPVGTLGYVSAGLELAEQLDRNEAPVPDVVHVACGTMGTAAGLAVGFALAGLQIRVRAVRVVGRIVTGEGRTRRLARATLRLLRRQGLEVPPDAAAVELLEMDHDRLGPGYGQPTERGRKAMERFARMEIGLDATYTGKAGAGFLASVEEEPEKRHLFWHTLSATLPDAGSDDESDEWAADASEAGDTSEDEGAEPSGRPS